MAEPAATETHPQPVWIPPPSIAFPRKKKPALTAKESLKLKAQARAAKQKPSQNRSVERATAETTVAAGEAQHTTPGRAGDAAAPELAVKKAAASSSDAVKKAAAGSRGAVKKAATISRDPDKKAAANSSGAAQGAPRRDDEQAEEAPAPKPGLLRRLMNLFRRS